MRQIILDTETTGLEPEQGHRIIEIGCVEMVKRRLTGNNYHRYLNPEREIDEAAIEVHGITLEKLQDEPRFADIARELIAYLDGAELIIHNAPFDIGFLDHELKLSGLDLGRIADHCRVVDTLVMAREKHPGQKNSLDALCRRYDIDNSQRTFHGALLDAEILADVYLAMTGGQISFLSDAASGEREAATRRERRGRGRRPRTPVVLPGEKELALHERWLELLEKESGRPPRFRALR